MYLSLDHLGPTDHGQKGKDTEDTNNARFCNRKAIQPVNLVVLLDHGSLDGVGNIDEVRIRSSYCIINDEVVRCSQVVASQYNNQDDEHGDSQCESDNLCPFIASHCEIT